jgi:hypothetical protein
MLGLLGVGMPREDEDRFQTAGRASVLSAAGGPCTLGLIG